MTTLPSVAPSAPPAAKENHNGSRPPVAEPSANGDQPTSLRSWAGGLYSRRIVLVAIYALVLYVARWAAYQLRFDFNVPESYRGQVWERSVFYIPLQIACLAFFGQFSGILRYFGMREGRRLCYAIGLATCGLYLVGHFAPAGTAPPRGVILLGAILSVFGIGGLRAAWRMFAAWDTTRRLKAKHPLRRVGIVGAGDAGADLIRDLKERPRFGLEPVALFDDDPGKWRSEVYGVPIVGPPSDLVTWAKELELEEVAIAMPSAPPKRLREIFDIAQEAKLRTVTVPSLGQLAAGHVRVSQLRPVNIADVLGREAVDLKLDQIRPLLEKKVVLVTGAGGSIGSELCRQVVGFNPRLLLLVEQSEGALFLIEQELIKRGFGDVILPIVADIADPERMRAVLAGHTPQVLFHAAAHKHVPMMERQPSEAIKNNTFGTANLADLAQEHGVGHFVLISTDKAVNPTSVMGATKRLAEIYLQALAGDHPNGTRFIAVRFGNVLGSSGSVVPIFTEQIAAGGPVTVTDERMVRYFMTIPEAVGLVLQSFALGQGGEIFVLEMGEPVRIAEMAATMIRLSGLEPGRDIEIKFTGLRPGEKLYEELSHADAIHDQTSHSRILRFKSQLPELKHVRAQLAELRQLLNLNRPQELKHALRKIIPEYTPFNGQAVPAPSEKKQN